MHFLKKISKTFKRKKHEPIIDDQGRLFGRIDLFIPLLIVIVVTLGILIGRVLMQKDTYVVAELFASGGEWWWDNPSPPYWLADPIVEGAVEYDPQGNKVVEILEVRKFEVAERKMLWMKARLKVAHDENSQTYRFRREPLQIGSVVFVSPNQIKVASNVLAIEGVSTEKETVTKTVTLEEFEVSDWWSEKINVGDVMLDDKGNVLAEVLEKEVREADMITTDDRGAVHVVKNPLKRDLKVKIRMTLTKSADLEYFSYFQPIKIGFYMMVPLSNLNVTGYITEIGEAETPQATAL